MTEVATLGLTRINVVSPAGRAVTVIKFDPDARVPVYSTRGAAGADLASIEDTTIPARGHKLVRTGIGLILPGDMEAQVRPRSGLALKRGITVLNSPGTIDSDYRGEIGVILYNTTDIDFVVQKGDRIAQLVVAPFYHCHFMTRPDIPTTMDTERGNQGFGSTGLAS